MYEKLHNMCAFIEETVAEEQAPMGETVAKQESLAFNITGI